MPFDFSTPGRIVFGPGTIRILVPSVKCMGARALLVAGTSAEPIEGVACAMLTVEGEPTLDLVRRGCALAREERCDTVIALGGGSAIDAGKAIAALLTNPGDPLDYLEVIGAGKHLRVPSVPFIAVPTTAGTGAEVTRNAVLASPEHGVKASLRSSFLLPQIAIIDPELTFSLPPAVTASTGLDALTQVIEPFVSVRSNAMTDMFCREGMLRAARSLARAFHDGSNAEARTDMSMTSLLGGLSLANAGLGAVHGFAAPIGGSFHAPHGAVCAALLPHCMAMNVRALRARAAGSEALARYAEIGQILTGRPGATAEDGIEWVGRLCRELEVPPLRAYGIGEADIEKLVANSARASSMKGNPVVLNPEELREILTSAI